MLHFRDYSSGPGGSNSQDRTIEGSPFLFLCPFPNVGEKLDNNKTKTNVDAITFLTMPPPFILLYGRKFLPF